MSFRVLAFAVASVLACGPAEPQLAATGAGGSGGDPQGGGGQQSGGGGAGGTGGEPTGGGGMAPCVLEDCELPGDECLVAACVDGACGTAPAEQGTEVAEQLAADCRTLVCDGEGSTENIPDDADLPVDTGECIDDACSEGNITNTPTGAGTPCGTGDDLMCDGAGSCVGCTMASQCGTDTECVTFACVNNECVPTFTTVGTLTSSQTAGDCKRNVCDGGGAIISQNDNTDPENDSNACTSDTCSNGTPMHSDLAFGTACGSDFCDGMGNCAVDCLTHAHCGGSQLCTTAGDCSTATLVDGSVSGVSTRVQSATYSLVDERFEDSTLSSGSQVCQGVYCMAAGGLRP